jgi:hypothetical protein
MFKMLSMSAEAGDLLSINRRLLLVGLVKVLILL